MSRHTEETSNGIPFTWWLLGDGVTIELYPSVTHTPEEVQEAKDEISGSKHTLHINVVEAIGDIIDILSAKADQDIKNYVNSTL